MEALEELDAEGLLAKEQNEELHAHVYRDPRCTKTGGADADLAAWIGAYPERMDL